MLSGFYSLPLLYHLWLTFHLDIKELGSVIDNEQAIYNGKEIKNPFENVHYIYFGWHFLMLISPVLSICIELLSSSL